MPSINLEELLLILSEQQKQLLQLADTQREIWGRHLDAAFHRILEHQAGSVDQGGRKPVVSGSPGEDMPQGSSAPWNLRGVQPTERPRALEEDEMPLSWQVHEDLRIHEVEAGREVPEVPEMDGMDGSTNRGFGATARGSSSFDRQASRDSPRDKGSTFKSIVTEQWVFQEEAGRERCFARIMRCLDPVASVLVFLNAVVMLVEFEMAGRATGSSLGLSDGPFVKSELFRALGITFDLLFTVELGLRIVWEGYAFGKDVANLFDSVLVTAGLAEHFLVLLVPEDPLSSQLMRALSSIRAIRMLRAFRFSQGLKLLLNACQSFISSLCWSMVLLGVVMVVASLIIGNLLQDYLRDAAVSSEDRAEIWRFYGTAYRSWYTLYEVTFAGNWPTMARPVLDKVSHGFVIFVLYITIIVFALIRVITAVFLKDTLDAANNDAELRMAEGLRKKAEYVEKLEHIFQAIDDSGDGMITEERLTHILENPKVKAYFQTLDVDVHEGAALFHILDDGDGECTLEEFIGGILRCKGPARAIDQVAMMADLRQLDKKLSKLIQALSDSELIPAPRMSGEFVQKVKSSLSDARSRSEQSSKEFNAVSRRRASDAAQTFLYRTAMMPKLKNAASMMESDALHIM